MNLDQLLGLTRALLQAGAGLALGYGIDGNTYALFGGFVTSVATLAWGVYTHVDVADQAQSFVRAAIGFVGGWAVHRGYVSADVVTSVTGAALTVLPAIWSFIAHKDAKP
jgi:hypothetical protein